MGGFYSGNAYLSVDLGEVGKAIDYMRGVLSRQNFEKLMHRTFKEVGQRSKKPIGDAVINEYAVGRQWVNKGIGSYRLKTGGYSGVTCVIPLAGNKGSIGGRFTATGGSKGVRIRSRILKKRTSTLPTVMARQGGNAPFINRKSSVLGKAAFTRVSKERFPIVAVKGLALPQMPLNQSANEVAQELLELAAKRLEHNFNYMISTGFK